MNKLLLNCFLFSSLQLLSQPQRSEVEHYCLEVTGVVETASEGDHGSAVLVQIISNHRPADTILLNRGNKKFKYRFEKNSHYAIVISRKNYLSKLISVNSRLGPDVPHFYRFQFNTQLIPDHHAPKLNQDLLDFPAAIIFFDPKNSISVTTGSIPGRSKKSLGCREKNR